MPKGVHDSPLRGRYERTAEHREQQRRLSTQHGMSRTPTWYSWSGMVARCTNPRHKDYQRYGGRGIVVCERWLVFENFLADMGIRPEGTTLDRIDSDGNYEPSNCRWANSAEQRINQQRKVRMADCHPDRKHCANGLCRPCWRRQYKITTGM